MESSRGCCGSGEVQVSSNVWQHLIVWATLGVVGAVLGGPPCRTISRCRAEQDGGPPPVRDRGEGRWGLDGLSGGQLDIVREDSVLWLRFLFLYAIAQAAADGPPCIPAAGGAISKTASSPTLCGSSDGMATQGSGVAMPTEVTDPLELAQWALQQAAANLGFSSETAKGFQGTGHQQFLRDGRLVMFGWEHPRDPEEYLEQALAPPRGWASWWAFQEWSDFSSVYSTYLARFDQGKFGHVRPKPTSFATNSWFLYEALDQQFLTESERQRFGKGPSAGKSRLQEAPTWARWAPGLSAAVQAAWCSWKREQGEQGVVEERKLWLAKLTEDEMFQRHVGNDHVPFRKGCPVCIAAQGRQRSHWRAAVTGLYSASFDLAGPFVDGHSFDPVASGRDKGRGYRFFLACAFTVPVSGVPGVEERSEIRLEGDEVSDEPPMLVEASGEAGDFGAGVSKVTHRVVGKRPESPDDPSGPDDGVRCPDAFPLEDPPLPPPSEPPAPVKTRTLFLGVPLRSKRSKEVFPAVQAVINRLESYGFPVHRYHADRAQELRARPLVEWCRARGIHATWTPGEAPAGNKAELAVQQLKGLARKLLAVAELGPSFWPLAVLHASRRNWVHLCSDLGIPQPTLLPFGVRLQARQRHRSGFASHWRSRTVPGLYLGQAPDTPGGHLVLVDCDGEEKKVLLTNTVYPLGPKTPELKKPKYRLRGKSAPDFVLRTVRVSATCIVVPDVQGSLARLSPGGEWGKGELESDSESVQNEFESDFALAHGDEKLAKKNCFDESGRFRLDADGEPRELLDEWDASLGGLGCLHLCRDSEAFLKSCLEAENYEFDICLEVLRRCVKRFPSPKRSILEGDRTYAVLGLYCQGGLRGITRYAKGNEDLTRYINRFVAHHYPEGQWTTLYLSRNTVAPMHRDARNGNGGLAWIVGLGQFQGGGLWIEKCQGPTLRKLPDGRVKPGTVLNIHDEPQLFDSTGWHEAEAWVGEDRWVIVAYAPRDFQAVVPLYQDALKGLGFPVQTLLNDSTRRDGEYGVSWMSKLKDIEYDGGASKHWGDSSLEGCGLDLWEVDFPCELLDEESYEAGVAMHQAAVHFKTRTAQELTDAVRNGYGREVVEMLRVARLECEWYESLLAREQPAVELQGSIRAICTDVPLGTHDPEPDEIFLQTRTISLEQARQELPLWRPAALEEVQSLETVTQAVERVSTQEVNKWVSQGYKVLQIPGKAVLTRKAGVGRRRFRAVCCGNYLQQDLSADSLYAAGVDAATVRTVIAFVSLQCHWVGVVADIKTAFLHAPLQQVSQQEIWIVKPPHLLVDLKILEPTDRWRILKALYGLKTSPRDWAMYRDATIKDLTVNLGEKVYRFFQAQSDEALWLIRVPGLEIEAVMVIYVDDFIVFGVLALCRAVIEVIQHTWKLSDPEWLEVGKTVKFCGLEVVRTASGFRVTQESYLTELLAKYSVDDVAPVPMVKSLGWLTSAQHKLLQGLYYGCPRGAVRTFRIRLPAWLSTPLSPRNLWWLWAIKFFVI